MPHILYYMNISVRVILCYDVHITCKDRVQKDRRKPVAAHFNTRGHSVEDMEVMVTDRLWTDDPVLRKIRESRWIRTLDTSYPRGTNRRTDTL